MPTIGDTKVWISIDGKELLEYQTEEEEEGVVKCYIPSQTGKNFEISVHDNSDYLSKDVATKLKVSIDGTHMGRAWVTDNGELTIEGVRGTNFFRKFQFTNLNVTDDDSFRSTPSATVGTIKVTITWAGPGVPANPPNIASLANDPVHERTKKMTTHRVKLVEEKAELLSGWVTRKDWPQYPPIVFHFHYMNEDLLMARNIMPTPVPDGPTAQKRPIELDDSDPEDGVTKEEEEMFKRLQEKMRRRDIKRVKTEIKPEPEVLTVLSNGVIDLTD